jgi:hypothetical protein
MPTTSAEKEVKREAVGEPVVHIQRAIQYGRKKMESSNAIHIVGPIDEQSAPDHDPQQRKVDPVEPANSSEVFQLQFLHGASIGEAAFPAEMPHFVIGRTGTCKKMKEC